MNYPVYWTTRLGLRIAYGALWGLEVIGRERVPAEGPVILACNHASYLDPPILGAAFDRVIAFMARESLFGNPLFGWYIRALNAFPLDRDGDPRTALRAMCAKLETGACVTLFPEGTRTETGRMGPVKRGVGMLAVRSGAPVLPVYIGGSFESWPKGRGQPRRFPLRVETGTLLRVADDLQGGKARRAEEERIRAAVEQDLRRLEAAYRVRRGLALPGPDGTPAALSAPAAQETP
ncbi:MAG: lysophospholipid acyltransferase family protein [Planctomycetota bacterium]